MHTTNHLIVLGCAALLGVGIAYAAPRTDNTEQNQASGATADDQQNDKHDLDVTAQIRRSVIEDHSLSTSAHNVKIIAQHGVVTLRGPVKTTGEKRIVCDKAKEVVGDTHVKDELKVAS